MSGWDIFLRDTHCPG